MYEVHPINSDSATWWTAPVRIERRPAIHKLARSCWVFVLVFGTSYAAFQLGFGRDIAENTSWPAVLFFGLLAGVPLAVALSGLLVVRQGRRFTASSIVLTVLLLLAPGLLLQPGLALFCQAIRFSGARNPDDVRWMVSELDRHLNDLRCLPARWIVENRLRDMYFGVLLQFAAEPPTNEHLNKDFRNAFRELLADLMLRDSNQIVLEIHEEPVPPIYTEALSRSDFFAAESAFKFEFSGQEEAVHVIGMCDALRHQLQEVLPGRLLSWVDAKDASDSSHPRIVFHARCQATDRIIVHGSSRQFVPQATWQVSLINSRGESLGQATFTAVVPREAQIIESRLRAWEWSDISVRMLYGQTAWELARRLGVCWVPEPQDYPCVQDNEVDSN